MNDLTGSYGRSLRKTGAAAWLLAVAMPSDVAIRFGLGDDIAADRSAGTRLVFDNDGNAQHLREAALHGLASNRIGATAWRQRDDAADGPVGPGPLGTDNSGKGQAGRGSFEKSTA